MNAETTRDQRLSAPSCDATSDGGGTRDTPGLLEEMRAEQAAIDAAYDRLSAMRQAAEGIAASFGDAQAGGTHQARLEREAARSTADRRLAALALGDEPLVFGRLDLDAAGDQATLRIGRLAVADEGGDALVVDWRAPVAEAFYRATPLDPMGVARRRRLLTRHGRGRELVGIDDEVFDPAGVESLAVAGDAALLAALERSRTGRMGDIVATIQGDQDAAIRAPLAGVLVVSGGAGTGKTAVALHRAAYLLYTHRAQLAGRQILLLGPSPVFLRYVSQVLPGLGEDGVLLATAADLVAVPVTGFDSDAAAAVKGDGRMADVIANAVRDRQRGLPRDLVADVDGHILRLTRGESRAIVTAAQRRPGGHNAQQPYVVRRVLSLLTDRYLAAVSAAGQTLALDDDEEAAVAQTRLRRARPVVLACERMWPRLTGAELVHDLLSFPALIASAAKGALTDEEQRALHRARSDTVEDVAWTVDDLALIDEADALLGPVPVARRAKPRATVRRDIVDAAAWTVRELGLGGLMTAADFARRQAGVEAQAVAGDRSGQTTEVSGLSGPFAHVLVDEAQDLSQMQWRVLARRCPSGSMTLVGDPGQASGPAAARDWDAVLATLAPKAGSRVVELSVNYRTPAEIVALAEHVLGERGAVASAVRSTGIATPFVFTRPDLLLDATARRAQEAVSRGSGTVAIIAPVAHHAGLLERLGTQAAAGGEALDAPVAVIDATQAKGLEFDEVLVVEPGSFVTDDVRGRRLLYVALTRATQRLTILHSRDLPEPLAAWEPADLPAA